MQRTSDYCRRSEGSAQIAVKIQHKLWALPSRQLFAVELGHSPRPLCAAEQRQFVDQQAIAGLKRPQQLLDAALKRTRDWLPRDVQEKAKYGLFRRLLTVVSIALCSRIASSKTVVFFDTLPAGGEPKTVRSADAA